MAQMHVERVEPAQTLSDLHGLYPTTVHGELHLPSGRRLVLSDPGDVAVLDAALKVVEKAEAYVDRHGEFLRLIRPEDELIGEGSAPRFALIDAVDELRRNRAQ